MRDFPALPGVYRLLFLYLEPASTLIPFLIIWGYPGSRWFYDQLIPGAPDAGKALDPRTEMAVWQLGSCYFLLSLISSFVLRAVRDVLPRDPAAQERLIAPMFLALGIADLTHIGCSISGLPSSLRMTPLEWNATTHGNITAVVVLFAMRVCWYLGIGRDRSWDNAKTREEKAL